MVNILSLPPSGSVNMNEKNQLETNKAKLLSLIFNQIRQIKTNIDSKEQGVPLPL